MAAWVRLLGARVGKDVYYDTSIPAEIDNVNIGDRCTILPAPETFVPHSIDRGMVQFAPIKMGPGCGVGIGGCLLPLSELGAGSSLGPLSVVLKGEILSPGNYAEGNPIVMHNEPPSTSYGDTEEGQSTTWDDDGNCCSDTCCCCCLPSAGQVRDSGDTMASNGFGVRVSDSSCNNKNVYKATFSQERVGLLDDERSSGQRQSERSHGSGTVRVELGGEEDSDDDSGTDIDDYW